MAPKLAIRSTAYICIFFLEIYCDGSFHVPQDCQYDLLYWPWYLELFLSLWVKSIAFPPNWLFLQFRLVVAKLFLTHLLTHFFIKTFYSLHITHFFINFIWLALLTFKKIYERPLFKPAAHWSATILNGLKTNILGKLRVWVWVLFNNILTSVGHLMPRKVRLVLSSSRVLGHGFFGVFL